jgi:hypothetical protein
MDVSCAWRWVGRKYGQVINVPHRYSGVRR